MGIISLETLPNELILGVLDKLGAEDIVAASRTNKHLHSLVQCYTASLSAHIISRERSRLGNDLQFLDLAGLSPDEAFRKLSQKYVLPIRSWPVHPWRLTSSRFASWYTASNPSILTYDEAVRLYCVMISLNCRVLRSFQRIREIIPQDLLYDIDVAISKVALGPPDDMENLERLSSSCGTYMPSLGAKDLEELASRIRSDPIKPTSYENTLDYHSRQHMIDFHASFRGTANLGRIFGLPMSEMPKPSNYGVCSARGWKILTKLLLDQPACDTGKASPEVVFWAIGGNLSAYFAETVEAWDRIEQLLEDGNGNSLRKAALLEEVCVC